jgi:DNA-binding winged helix-turn-helix (wHTH) protein
MRYRFGPFELDESLFELRRGSEVVPLQRRAFDALHYLVRRRGAIVSNRELLQAVWGSVSITKDAVPRAMMLIREALGDDVEAPKFVTTVRGRGYCFVATVEQVARTPAASMVRAPPLVGRASTIAILRERLERAATGAGGVVLVTGAPGLGKTRLLDAFARGEAAAFSPIILAGTGGETAPELRLMGELLAELRRRGTRLDGPLDALAAAGEASVDMAGPEATFRLLDRIVGVLASLTARSLVLLVIDDLHLVDPASLSVLELLAPRARSLSLLMVCAYDPKQSVRRGAGALARAQGATVITLEPLGQADVALYLEQLSGVPPSQEVLRQVCDKTHGHPMLVAELGHVLGALGAERVDLKTSELVGGPRMREAIAHELAAMPPGTVRTLTVAAVFGRTFALAPLAAALEATNADVLRDLDIAESSRAVLRSGAGGGGYRFTYPLVRDVLYKQLSVSERARLHGAAARALEHYMGSDFARHQDAGEIARHWVQAAPIGDVDLAIAWSLRAAALADAAGDRAAATLYAERGLSALDFAQRPSLEDRAKLVAACRRP